MTVRAKRGSWSESVATSRRPVSERRVGACACPSTAAVTTSNTARRSAVTALLLLEEVVEAAPDVARARRVGRGVALHRHAQREHGALVAAALVGDLLGDGLRALEAPARLEVGALAAGMNGRAAIRALLERRRRDGQDRSTRRASRNGLPGEHAAASRRIAGRPGRG